jgi:Mrp family chromosome partitioning ATPase
MAADEVVLTIARGEHSPSVEHAVHYLTSNGANLVGVVLNRADPSDITRSGYSSSISRRSKVDEEGIVQDLTPVELDGLNLGPVGAAVASLTDCGVKPPSSPTTPE